MSESTYEQKVRAIKPEHLGEQQNAFTHYYRNGFADAKTDAALIAREADAEIVRLREAVMHSQNVLAQLIDPAPGASIPIVYAQARQAEAICRTALSQPGRSEGGEQK